jgi:hypothetical protein
MSVSHLSTCPRVCYKVMPHVIFLFVQIAQLSAIKATSQSKGQIHQSFSAQSSKTLSLSLSPPETDQNHQDSHELDESHQEHMNPKP